ncbi:MAG TPA: DNA mismatch repair protein MutS [Cycloclasticus sp.]|jgi:DNA mismatch repair ATPase MutS|nr:DNA mismatch repair protein MutS [Cycloclasticus sp.]
MSLQAIKNNGEFVLKKTPKMRELFRHIRKLMLDEETLRGNSGVPDGDGLIDHNSYAVIEVDKLLDTVDHAQTLVGKDTLHKAFSQHVLTPVEIEAKQQALKELAEDDELRASVDQLLKKAAENEGSFYRLLVSNFVGFIYSPDEDRLEQAGYGYRLYDQASTFLPKVVEEAKEIKQPKSAYIQGLLDELKQFVETRPYKLMAGPVYMLLGKFLLKDERSWRTPAIKLRTSFFKPMMFPLVFLISVLMPYILNISMAQFTVFSLIPFIILVFYVPLVGDFDKHSFIIPLRRLFARSSEVERAVQVIGQLDELMSYHLYAEKCVYKTILPNMVVADRQYIEIESAVNPVLGFADKQYVANDFDTSQHNLAFFTGPNSGGKTAFCKTLAQIQLLSQVGCYVPAEAARLTVADRVFYQTPEINSLDHDVGRFGTELKRTRDIFIAATPNSLVILDELAEGTTHKEKLETSLMILEAFKKLGSLTILVTHNHELAEHYLDGDLAVFRQVEFDGERPTHRFVNGVSIVSHADLVARSVGFSKEDIERILKEKLLAKSA